MLSLVYVSRPTMGGAELAHVLDDVRPQSLARNSIFNISGILIATPNYFAEFLEGPVGNVETVMGSIAVDTRHQELRMLQRTYGALRRYPNWQLVRFDGGNVRIGRVLAAAHAQGDPGAVHNLANLFDALAPRLVLARG